jgi:hypothetical protein
MIASKIKALRVVPVSKSELRQEKAVDLRFDRWYIRRTRATLRKPQNIQFCLFNETG